VITSSEKLQRFGMVLHAGSALITLAIVLVMFGVLYLRLDTGNRKTAGLVLDKQQFLESARSISSTHDQLEQQLRDEEARLKKMIERIPATPQESGFLGELAKLARESGVSIQQFSRGVATEKQTHSEMQVQLSANASHASICRFLSGLAGLRRLCHVRDVSISKATKADQGYPIEITLRIFFAPLRQARIDARGSLR